MRYIIPLLFIALTLPLSAQTVEIDSLKAEYLALNHEIQKAEAAYNFKSITLDSALVAVGYRIEADTTDAEYVVFIMPDSLAREALLDIREVGDRGIPFIKTNNPNVIRVHRNRLSRIVKALNP